MKTVMKKIISGILIVASLLLCLCGCSLLDKFICTDGNTETPDNNEVVQFAGTPVANDSDMIKAIVDYFYNQRVDHHMGLTTLVYKLEDIEYHNVHLLEITFAPFEYYFLCGYDNQETPITGFSRDTIAKKCHWFIFESEDQIPEYYNGEKCVFAFQFNKADSVIDLLYDDTAPVVEHFLEYAPQFKDGFNVASPLVVDETIFYLDMAFYYSGEKVNYYSTASFFNPWRTLNTVEIEGEVYTIFPSKHLFSDDNVDIVDSIYQIGDYYELFADVIHADRYSYTTSYGMTTFYSCIEINDFVKVIREEILVNN